MFPRITASVLWQGGDTGWRLIRQQSLMGKTSRGVCKRLVVKGGEDEAMVPFRFAVDFGSVRLPLAERHLSAPRSGAGPVEFFEFTPEEPTRDIATQEVTIAPAAAARAPAALPPITVSVYQHGMFCEIVEIAQEITSASVVTPAAPAQAPRTDKQGPASIDGQR